MRRWQRPAAGRAWRWWNVTEYWGGNLTAGYVGPILGMVGSGTMRDELMALLGVPENDMIGEVGVAHDMEQAKRVLAEFVFM